MNILMVDFTFCVKKLQQLLVHSSTFLFEANLLEFIRAEGRDEIVDVYHIMLRWP